MAHRMVRNRDLAPYQPAAVLADPETTGRMPRKNGAFPPCAMRSDIHLAHLHRILLATLLLCALAMKGMAQGEEREGDLVYRFKLVGVNDPVAAKPVQYVLLETADVHMCTFVEEERYLKLACPRSPGHSYFRSLLPLTGHELDGPVLVSDGSVIMQGENARPER